VLQTTNLWRATECRCRVSAFEALLAQTEVRQCHVTLQSIGLDWARFNVPLHIF